MFKDKILLITGGTGSFGTSVLKHFIDSNLSEIRIFSRDEEKQEKLRIEYKNPKIKFYVGDVRDFDSINDALIGVDFVFHAAALKQVPSCEFFPIEAFKTNVLGSENLIKASLQRGVKKVIFLSTDKAVYPVNAMGISKSMMEKLVIAKSRSYRKGDTIFCCTRYGNVLGSRGSVIPLFFNQLKNKNKVTVTDPNMTRFFMTLEDSVELVIHAFKNGNPGDIFVQKSPAFSIGDLATAMADAYGNSSKIEIIGTRHGEKLFETLVSREEMVRAEIVDNYFRIPFDNRTLNYDMYFNEGSKFITESIDYTSHNTKRLNLEEIKKVVKKVI